MLNHPDIVDPRGKRQTLDRHYKNETNLYRVVYRWVKYSVKLKSSIKVVSEKKLENPDAEEDPGTAQTNANSIHLALVLLKVFSYPGDGLKGA